jgi:SagB-type dehydrogenase family enzyme
MTSFLPNLHSKLRHAQGDGLYPLRDIPIGQHKTYPRMKQLVLPTPLELLNPLSKVLNKRRSFDSCEDGALTVQEWSTLLGAALGKHGNSEKRNYPSGGGLYPIETYLVVHKFADTEESGVFHYNPTAHTLEHLWELPADFDIEKLILNGKDFPSASIIIFTSVWKRSSIKYGDFTYQLALLEAGHMSENVLLTATAINVGARPLAGFDDGLMAGLLDINEKLEQGVLAIAVGQEKVTIIDE